MPSPCVEAVIDARGLGNTRKNMMPLNPILIVDLFYVWGIDFMRPFLMSFGYSYILVGVDYVLNGLKQSRASEMITELFSNFSKRTSFPYLEYPRP